MTHEEMDPRTLASIRRDEHYLRRIDRLNPSHAELALALYRDAGLVKELLVELDLPEGAERIAISLDDPLEGPFIVVTRAGHFVTCLGRGMSAGELPVVSRADLDRLSQHVQAVRKLLHDLKTGDQRETRLLFDRVLSSGDRLSREEFAAAARWLPLMRESLLEAVSTGSAYCAQGYEMLLRAKKASAPRFERHARSVWQELWALSHYALLLGVDGGSIVERFYTKEELGAEPKADAPRHFGMLGSLGLSSAAARASWFMARLPSVFVEPLEQAYADERDPCWTVAYGLGLYATGLLHADLRPELTRVLSRSYPHDGQPKLVLDTAVRDELSAQHALGVRASDEAHEQTLLRARAAASELVRRSPSLQRYLGDPNELPDDAVAAWLLAVPCDLFTDLRGLRCLAEWLPWIVHLPAEQFYLPKAYLPARTDAFATTWALSLLEPRRKLHQRLAEGPRRVPETPGRNDPCPCGSGKKYKRCCATAR